MYWRRSRCHVVYRMEFWNSLFEGNSKGIRMKLRMCGIPFKGIRRELEGCWCKPQSTLLLYWVPAVRGTQTRERRSAELSRGVASPRECASARRVAIILCHVSFCQSVVQRPCNRDDRRNAKLSPTVLQERRRVLQEQVPCRPWSADGESMA